jgi:hypothetical protein
MNKDYPKTPDELNNVVCHCGQFYPFLSQVGQAINDADRAIEAAVWVEDGFDENRLKTTFKNLYNALTKEKTKFKLWELTQSELFKHTYWGNFDAESLDDYFHAANRDQLVHEYRIVKHVKSKKRPQHRGFDHIEVYLTESGEVVVFTSPYKYDEDMIKFEFVETHPIYHRHATTYRRVFKDLKKWYYFCLIN